MDNISDLDFAKAYPEHAKLERVQHKSQWLGAFLDDMQTKGFFIGKWVKDNNRKDANLALTATESIQQLLAIHLDVNLIKLEEEKVKMLEEFRKNN